MVRNSRTDVSHYLRSVLALSTVTKAETPLTPPRIIHHRQDTNLTLPFIAWLLVTDDSVETHHPIRLHTILSQLTDIKRGRDKGARAGEMKAGKKIKFQRRIDKRQSDTDYISIFRGITENVITL